MNSLLNFRTLGVVIAVIFSTNLAIGQNSWNTTAIFNGSNYISSYDYNVNGTNGAMTVEFWLKPSDKFSNYTIIGKTQFRIMTDNGKIRVQASNSTYLFSNKTLDSGVWTHVAVSFNATTDEMKIYLNGTQDNSISNFGIAFTGTADSLITGKSGYQPNLNGELDEVRIWKTVRTSTEIANNYKLHLSWYYYSSYDANLIYVQTYDFDVHSPGFYLPYGGDHGSFSGNVIGNKPSKTVIHNNSMFFNGINTYLESTSASDPDVSLTGPLTVEAWIYPTTIGTKQTLLDLTSGGTGGFKLTLEASGKINWIMNQTGTGNSVLTANKWYHIAVVCANPSSGSQVASIFINGKLDIGYNYSELIANTGKLRIGANQFASEFFSGFMDDIRISNFSKTSLELLKSLHSPVNYETRPTAPRTTVAYNLDGALYSGTRTGYAIKSVNGRFSYASETSSPLFHTGYGHQKLMDSFIIKHPFVNIPEVGTAGYTTDTLHFEKDLIFDANKFKVFLSMNHSNMQELRVELISPFNDSITLYEQYQSNGFTGILDNSVTDKINGQYVDFSPRIGCANPLSKFNGKNCKGVWKLKITDLNNGNTGVLSSWGLQINGDPYINSLHSITSNNMFSVFPNPNNGKTVTIASSQFDISACKVEITNMLGQSVYNVTSNQAENEITLGLPINMPPGLYLVTINSGEGTFTSKLIIE